MIRYLRRHAVRIGLSLALVVLFLLNGVNVVHWGFIDRAENYAYDMRLLWTMPNTQDKRIVIVDIDEKSLQALGHWPWSRNKLALIIDQLFDHYKINVLGFDVVFAENDTSSGLAKLTELGQDELLTNAGFQTALERLKKPLDYDQLFADSLKGRRVVLGYAFGQQKGPVTGQLPVPLLQPGDFDAHGVDAPVAGAYTANLPELQKSASAGGFFNSTPMVDSDGVLRRISLVQNYEGALYETLGLAVSKLALDAPFIDLIHA